MRRLFFYPLAAFFAALSAHSVVAAQQGFPGQLTSSEAITIAHASNLVNLAVLAAVSLILFSIGALRLCKQ